MTHQAIIADLEKLIIELTILRNKAIRQTGQCGEDAIELGKQLGAYRQLITNIDLQRRYGR